ncbi:hypothetical protein ICC28_09060 [Streptomyces sp. TRM68416]|nr:hypothetical protein [Streptomyces sp. TRM68416]
MAGCLDEGHGTKNDGRQAVLSALPPNGPDTVVITGIGPGLQIQFTHPPVADWLCSCGHHERARGKAAVIELTTCVRVGQCPHRTTPTHERRNAA